MEQKTPAEIILIGGASVLINYGFRQKTYDIDAIIRASSSMKEAINKVGDKLNLPNGWINSDFTRTTSYSPKLVEHSKYYKTFSNVLQIRTVSAEYLVAMKLMSGRVYKNDLSDVAGIVSEQRKMGEPITIEKVKIAAEELYGDFENLPIDSKIFIQNLLNEKCIEKIYDELKETENENAEILLEHNNQTAEILNENNLAEVLNKARSQRNVTAFIMMCGLPGSGKTKMAKKLCIDYMQKGYELKDAKTLFPVQNIIDKYGVVLSKEDLLRKDIQKYDCSNSVAYISANDIRKELEDNHIYPDHDTIFKLAEIRIKIGLSQGAIVVFDASNIEKDVRKHYVDLAKEQNVKDIKLYVTNSVDNQANVPVQFFEELKNRLKNNQPSYDEGWSYIEEFHNEQIRELQSIEDWEL